MVDTRSTLLIDDGIGIQSNRWWPTTHQFDENLRVLLDQRIRAPAENEVLGLLIIQTIIGEQAPAFKAAPMYLLFFSALSA